jgi:tetratricopeptide (TPR) repeat protein
MKGRQQEPVMGQNNSRQHILLTAATIIVCAAVVWTHWPALSAKAMLFDDDQYLTQNMLVQNPSWASAKRFLTEVLEPSTVGGYYQPLTMISLMFDCALGGSPENLMPFHRTSLILHACNTALVIVLLYMLFGRVWIAAGLGLLFGVHPMTVEPIAWVGDRKTVLAAFFALWCLVFYVRYAQKNRWPYYISALLMYLAAVMSKPTALPVPILMLLLDLWPIGRRGKKILVEKIPFFAVMLAFAVITYISQQRTAAVELAGGYGLQKILSVVCYSITFYLHKIVWPVNLSAQYPPERLELANPVIVASIVGTALLIVVLLVSLRWTRAFFVGGFFFLIGILPTVQIFRFSYVFTSDKYAYLPAFGLLLILMWLLIKVSRKPVAGVAAAVVILALSAAEMRAARAYLVYWRDTISLCEHMLSFSDAGSIHDMLGRALQEQGRLDEAAYQFRRALELEPDDAVTYSNYGITLAAQGKMDEAIHCFDRSIKIDPNFSAAYNNLGLALAGQHKYEQAVSSYRKAIELKPDFFQAYNNLGLSLRGQKKFDEAVDNFHKAIAIKEDYAVAYYNLAYTLWMTGKADEALKYFQRAADLAPDDPIILNGLANILLTSSDVKMRNIPRALALAQRAAEITGYHNIAAVETLAMAYAASGRFNEAIAAAQKGLELALAAHDKDLADRLQQKIGRYKNGRQ